MNKFIEVTQERMDFISAHIGSYNVSEEVRELLAMIELMQVLEPSADVYGAVEECTGYTVKQLSNYALEVGKL